MRKEEKGDAYVLPDRVSQFLFKWRVHTRIRVTELPCNPLGSIQILGDVNIWDLRRAAPWPSSYF